MSDKKKTKYYVFQELFDKTNLVITQDAHYQGDLLYEGFSRHYCLDFIDKWHKTHDWFYEKMKRDEEEANKKTRDNLMEIRKMINDYIQEYVDKVWLKLLSTKAETFTKESVADILLNSSTWDLHIGDKYPTDKLEANNECRKVN